MLPQLDLQLLQLVQAGELFGGHRDHDNSNLSPVVMGSRLVEKRPGPVPG
jgi:hypothetical protein